jgi:hypothetical protein
MKNPAVTQTSARASRRSKRCRLGDRSFGAAG